MAAPAIRPMLCTPSARLPVGGQWAYEIKWDGARLLCEIDDTLSARSRAGLSAEGRWPELDALAGAFAGRRALLDGEIICCDEQGRPDFGRLQSRLNLSAAKAKLAARAVPARLVVFDLLWLDGELLCDRPYVERRERLEQLWPGDEQSWTCPQTWLIDDGAALLQSAGQLGLEGLVAKRRTSRYEPGRRSPAWLKVKLTRRQEFVVGGVLGGDGGRSGQLGALLVGYYDERGQLRYAGEVGSGFSDAALRQFATLLPPLACHEPPFCEQDRRRLDRHAIFVRPQLVVEVEFLRLAHTGLLREPRYRGLRDDVDPAAVRLELSDCG